MNFACVYVESVHKYLVYHSVEDYNKKVPNEVSDELVEAKYYMFVFESPEMAKKVAGVVK